MSRGRGGFFNRGGHGFQKKIEKPLFSMQNSMPMDIDEDDGDHLTAEPGTTYLTDRDPGEYAGWKLYFPKLSFKHSHDIVRRIKAVEMHFDSFSSWYDTDITETGLIPLNLRNLNEDKVLRGSWPEFIDELVQEPTQTLASVALAMHNIISKSKNKKAEYNQQHKIYAQPIGHEPIINICDANETSGALVSVTGQIVRVDAQQPKVKMLCFRCILCSAELVVRQNPDGQQYTHPSTCIKGCNARSGFVELFSSPHTVFQSKQMIKLRESTVLENQELGDLLVEVPQGLVESVKVGMSVTVTGVIKHSKEKFKKSAESKPMKSYLKCFNIECSEKAGCQLTSSPSELNAEFIKKMRAERSPFRLLVNSLCPMVFGRKQIKAGLILSILSGKNLLNVRRSESHVLLIGNPGTGKSKLLQSCVEVSSKGVFVNGPTSTGPGLTASVGKKGNVDAGALILSNGGVCCIDEFDKMASSTHILLEVTEQQMVSITKFGANANFEARVNIIAAANPTGSYLDNSKTLIENTRIASPMLSRFDLVFKVQNHERNADPNFLSHISFIGQQDQSSSSNASFFETPVRSEPGDDDPIPQDLMKFYCEYVRENFRPKLSEDAKNVLFKFFTDLRSLHLGSQVQTVTHRQLEALLRLTLARARADMCHEATLEHATDVISLVKYSMSDIFATEEPDVSQVALSFKTPAGRGVSTTKLSIPKQVKAFLEHLECQDQTNFTRTELKAMASEIGIRDFDTVIWRLNDEGVILKTADGYKMA